MTGTLRGLLRMLNMIGFWTQGMRKWVPSPLTVSRIPRKRSNITALSPPSTTEQGKCFSLQNWCGEGSTFKQIMPNSGANSGAIIAPLFGIINFDSFKVWLILSQWLQPELVTSSSPLYRVLFTTEPIAMPPTPSLMKLLRALVLMKAAISCWYNN